MKIHELKIWPEFFDAVDSGKKKFDVRKNDRGFKEGDVLVLREFEPCENCAGIGSFRNGSMPDASSADNITCSRCDGRKGKYLERQCYVVVTYIMTHKAGNGVDKGFVVMSIAKADCGDEHSRD